MKKYITFVAVVLLLLQPGACEEYEDCVPSFFRIQNPPFEVNSWDCICKEKGDNMPIATGLANAFVPANETSLEHIWSWLICFTKAYKDHNLAKICSSTPSKFQEAAQPFVDQCAEQVKQSISLPGPFPYTRKYCYAYFTEARVIGTDFSAAFWMCQCSQPQWQVPGFPMPNVIDGRAMYPDAKAKLTDFLRKCTSPYESKFNYICQSPSLYKTFRNSVQEVYKDCCAKANKALGLNLDCPSINLDVIATKTVKVYPSYRSALYGEAVSYGGPGAYGGASAFGGLTPYGAAAPYGF